jgi:DNA-directed RNA polymerase omega subunit
MELSVVERALRRHPNRFELTMMGVARAKELAMGDTPLVEIPPGKKTFVIALTEIAGDALELATRGEMESLREIRRQAREAALMAERELEVVEEEVPLGTFNPLDFPES